MLTARIQAKLAKYELLKPLAVFVVALASLGYIQWSWFIADPDSFYHIKMAILMSRYGIIHDFPYLPFTVLQNIFIDHHLLYHLLLVPFVAIWQPIIGAKILQVLMASTIILVFYLILLKLKIKFPLFFSLVLLVSPAFVFRMSLIKAQPLSIIILLIGLLLIIKRKSLLLALLSFIYVWTYGGWVFLPVVCLIFVFTDATHFQKENSSILRNAICFIKSFVIKLFSSKNIFLVGSCWLGALAGLVINPYFPRNINFYLIQTFQIPFTAGNKIILGTEWHHISQITFLTSLLLPLILICLGIVMTCTYKPKLDLKSKFLLALTLIFILATFKSQRNVEYLTPITLMASAMIITISMATSKFSEDAAVFRQKIMPFVRLKIWALFIILISLTCLCATAINVKFVLGKARFDSFEQASKFIASRSQPGDIIYHSSWDQFPALFYFNDQNRYVSGLDPTFLYSSNPLLYEKMTDLSYGKRKEEAYNIIKDDFHAKYIFTASRWTKFIETVENDSRFKKVYSDKNATVYEVL